MYYADHEIQFLFFKILLLFLLAKFGPSIWNSPDSNFT